MTQSSRFNVQEGFSVWAWNYDRNGTSHIALRISHIYFATTCTVAPPKSWLSRDVATNSPGATPSTISTSPL